MSKFEPERGTKRQSKFEAKFGVAQSGSRPGTVDGSSPSSAGSPIGLLLILTHAS
jgi:hypothetical protein